MRTFLSTLPVALGLASGAVAQQSQIFVDPIDTVYEDTSSASWLVTARNIENAYPAINVDLDGVDVTSLVALSWSDETRVDANQDGYLEGFRATLTLDLSAAPVSTSVEIRVKAAASIAGGGSVEHTLPTWVVGHVQVYVSPSAAWEDDLPAEMGATVYVHNVPSGSMFTARIFKDGVDVTAGTSFTLASDPVALRSSGQEDQWHYVYIDVSSLGSVVGGTSIAVRGTITYPASGGAFDGNDTVVVGDGDQEPVPTEEDKLCAFIDALGITQAGNGTGPVTMSVTDKGAIRAAAHALKTQIQSCLANENQEYEFEGLVPCPGGPVCVKVVIGGSGPPQGGTGAGQGANTGTGQDTNCLVIAIGGCGRGPSSGGGGAQAAGGDGAVTIAVGGDSTGTATGGSGTARMSGDGLAVGLGGTGGEGGGRGGDGSGGANSGGGGSAIAGGGPGGDSGPNSTGGDGGGAKVDTNTGGSCSQSGGPQGGGAGGPGRHGTGACAEADSAGGCTSTPGTSTPNT
jgi:hypothetical protein